MSDSNNEKLDGGPSTAEGTETLVSEKAPNSSGGIDTVPVGGNISPASSSNSSTDSTRHGITKADSHVVDVKDGEKEDDPFGHLPPEEAEVLRRQLDMPKVEISYLSLFRFATRNDQTIMVLSLLAAIIGGAVMPLMTIVFGELAGVFQKFMLGTLSGAGMQSELNRYTLYVWTVYPDISSYVNCWLADISCTSELANSS
jgi:hypothetical protein